MKGVKIVELKEWITERKIRRVSDRMNENKTKRVLTEKGRN